MLDAIGQRYSALPSEVLASDAINLRVMLTLQAAGQFDTAEAEGSESAVPDPLAQLPMQAL